MPTSGPGRNSLTLRLLCAPRDYTATPTPLPPVPDALDPAATARLYRAFHEPIVGFVRRRVPAADADDVAQEVFLRLHRAAHSLRDEQRAHAFVFGIARRTVADYHRRRRPATASLDDAPEPEAVPDDVHEEVLGWLVSMIALVPEPGRTALRMADLEGRSMAEIASATGLSVSGAKSRVQRARRALGKAVAACCAVEFGRDGRAVAYSPDGCSCEDASQCESE